MEYKTLPEKITSEPKSPSMMQPFDTIDVEKNWPRTTGYGTLPPSTINKEGRLSTSPPAARTSGIWVNFVQSLVAVGMFTVMGVVLVLVVL
ncbi:hypothetical protein ACMFMF_001950 [Clarireedia jacksonii]